MTTVQQIRKRDGRVVPFHENKIADAINKAFEATYKPGYEETAAKLAHEVASVLEVEGGNCPDVEHIQDIVERVLMDNGYVQTAKAYILYRSERNRAREMNTRLMKIYEDITFSSAKDSDIKRENANIDGDTAMGTMLKYGSEGSKQFYQMFVMKPEHARAHTSGDIHIHDMDFAPMGTTTCTQIDLIKLFDGGFSTGHGTLREPNDIASYAALACIAIQSNQNDQHGGQAIVNFDYSMAMGVRKTFQRIYRQNLARAVMLLEDRTDPESEIKANIQKIKEETGLYPKLEDCEEYFQAEMPFLLAHYSQDEAEMRKCQAFAHYRATKETDRATYQAMEALIHNLNTMHSRAGAQTPFSSINYGMDTSPEGRMVMKNVMLATEAGLGGGETPIFPIQIFRVKEGVNYNPGEPNYDLFQLAVRCSAKRLFPNFSFIDAPFNLQYYRPGRPETEIAYMGCRTRVIGNVYDPGREICNGRGNLSFTTINLPRLAIKARGDLDVFFEGLDRMLDLCVEQLLERFEIQCRKHVYNYPFLMGAWKLAPALAAGNSVIFKPSSNCVLSTVKMFEIFEKAGMPKGSVNLILGPGGSVGSAIAAHPGISMVTFTGSTAVGQDIMRCAAANVKKIGLELGGKSPNIIFADADLEGAVEWAMIGIFFNQGEVCSAGSRILIEESFKETFLRRLVERTNAITLGNPLNNPDMGPMVSESQTNRAATSTRMTVMAIGVVLEYSIMIFRCP